MEDGKMDAEELCEVLCQDGHVDECPKKELRREEQLEQTILIVRQEEAHEGYLKKRGDEMEPGDGVETPINTAEPRLPAHWEFTLEEKMTVTIYSDMTATEMVEWLMETPANGYAFDGQTLIPVRRIIAARRYETGGYLHDTLTENDCMRQALENMKKRRGGK